VTTSKNTLEHSQIKFVFIAKNAKLKNKEAKAIKGKNEENSSKPFKTARN